MGEAYPEKKNAFASHPHELGPSFERAQAKRAHLKVALLAERHARGPTRTGSACARRNWHGARATRSVYGWLLRSHVVEAAGARSS